VAEPLDKVTLRQLIAQRSDATITIEESKDIASKGTQTMLD